MITLKSVSKTYKLGDESLAALDNVSLTIKDGEFVAIIGPSGSGKSTLANMIGGLSEPSKGSIFFNDEELSELNDKQLSEYRSKTVGFVFQSFNLIPNYSVLENVMMPLVLANKGRMEQKERAIECLKLVGIENRAKHKATQLSGGERQRVSIARALANQPKIIIADEPTGNLDTKKSIEIVSLLRKLNKQEKITLIIITHDSKIADQADRIINIQDGKVKN